MDIKDSDIISGKLYNDLVKRYKEYDKKQKQLIYDLSNENYDLKLKVKELEEELGDSEIEDSLKKAFLEIIEKYCDSELFNKVRKWLKMADKSIRYKELLHRCEKNNHMLRQRLNGL